MVGRLSSPRDRVFHGKEIAFPEYKIALAIFLLLGSKAFWALTYSSGYQIFRVSAVSPFYFFSPFQFYFNN